jgi:hypothetical protein
MAKAIAENIAHATKDLENLYYTSIRVGSSATNLKALTQASQDFGVSAEEALGNIEALAQALRTDPGTEAFINALGVKTRDANHELRDTVDIANELGAVLAKRPDYMAQQLGELVGITYKFQRMIRDPGWLQDLEKHQQLLSKGGYGDAARDAALLEQQWRELGDRWDSLKKRFEVSLFGPLIEDFEKLSQWLEQHGPEIDGYVNDIARTIENFVKTIPDGIREIGKVFDDLLSSVKKVSDWFEAHFPKISHAVASAGDWFWKRLNKDVVPVPDEPVTPSARRAGPGVPHGVALNNPGNLEYAGQAGAVRAGGAPGERRFAAFRTADEGLLAMARQLELDFHRGRNTIEALIAKYAPPGENDTAGYINDVAGQMGTRGRAALNLNDPAVLSSLMNAMIQHENMANPYRPDTVRGAAEQAVKGAASLTQNNTINISGAKDPAETRHAVSEGLYDSYRKMTRNLQATTQ